MSSSFSTLFLENCQRKKRELFLRCWHGSEVAYIKLRVYSEEGFTWKHFESMPVEKAAKTIANIAIRKPCEEENMHITGHITWGLLMIHVKKPLCYYALLTLHIEGMYGIKLVSMSTHII